MPSLKVAALLGFIAASPMLLGMWAVHGSPTDNQERIKAKQAAIQAEVDYRCAKPGTIEVWVNTGLQLKVHKCK